MGLGDWLLATGQARDLNVETGKKIIFGDGRKRFYEPEILKDNPRIAGEDENGLWVPNFPGCRPYIRKIENGRMYFRDDFTAPVGELFGVRKSDRLKGKILVETRVKIDPKVPFTTNKAYPYWDDLLGRDLPIVRVAQVETNRFRNILDLLAGASLYVGTDGALHHAAAALGVPAVVIWTGYTSPKHLGYDYQVNIHDGSEPCGTISKVCPHCIKKAKNIDPEMVYRIVKSEFNRANQ